MTDQNKTRGLKPALNAAARMQALIQQPTAPKEEQVTQISTEVLTPVSDTLADASSEPAVDGEGKEPINNTSTAAKTPASTEAIKAVNRIAKKPEAKPASQEGGMHQRVRDKLSPRENREATVRLSIDVSESMHEKVKRYCLANRLPSTRALVILLLEDLLNDAGY